MASLGTITLTGKSNAQYEFNIYPRAQEFNAIGAVYVMAKKTSNNQYSIIYVGQTVDASQRPLNHHRTACFDKNGADHIFLLSESGEKKRLQIETDLIQKYEPTCNKQ